MAQSHKLFTHLITIVNGSGLITIVNGCGMAQNVMLIPHMTEPLVEVAIAPVPGSNGCSFTLRMPPPFLPLKNVMCAHWQESISAGKLDGIGPIM